jgi:hypothetical protein
MSASDGDVLGDHVGSSSGRHHDRYHLRIGLQPFDESLGVKYIDPLLIDRRGVLARLVSRALRRECYSPHHRPL